MIEEFVLRALIAGLCVALAAGPSGSLVVWLRMTGFGSAMAYAALFGASLAMGVQVLPFFGVLAAGILIALAVLAIDRLSARMGDMAVRVLAYGLLSAGLIAATVLPRTGFDLMAFLFGDILAMSWSDVILTAGTALGLIAVLAAVWTPMLRIAVSPDLARAEGLDVRRTRLIFTAGLAGLMAVAMQIVGALLIMALLVIPAVTARGLASSPARMGVTAAVIGAVSVAGGLSASLWQDVPAGPAIAACAALFFAASLAKRSVFPA